MGKHGEKLSTLDFVETRDKEQHIQTPRETERVDMAKLRDEHLRKAQIPQHSPQDQRDHNKIESLSDDNALFIKRFGI